MGKSISDLLGKSATPFAAGSPAAAEVVTEPKADVKTDAKVTPAAEPKAADTKAAPKVDTKPDIPKVETKPVEKKTDAKSTAIDTKADAKSADTKLDIATKPPLDWEAAENPYRKRYEDTRNWATQINQRLVEQSKQMDIVSKKLDGTYDPETDDKPAESSPQRQIEQATVIAKVKTSNAVAEQMFGKDTVQSLIWADNAPLRAYDDNPAVQARILAAEAPVLEAIQFLKEVEFFSKYGHDTEAIKKAVRSEFETELRTSVDQLVEERLKERLAKRDGAPSSLSTVAASDGPKGGNGAPGPTPLHKLGNAGFVVPHQR